MIVFRRSSAWGVRVVLLAVALCNELLLVASQKHTPMGHGYRCRRRYTPR